MATVRRNGKNKNSRTRNKMSSNSTIRKYVTSTLLKFYFCSYCKLWTHPTPYRIWSARYQLISEWESVTLIILYLESAELKIRNNSDPVDLRRQSRTWIHDMHGITDLVTSISDVVLVFLLSTLNIFHTAFSSVSIVFKQVNVSWVAIDHLHIISVKNKFSDFK